MQLTKTLVSVFAALASDVQTVPVMAGVPGDARGPRLTSAQQDELEMARRRADKAAKGKAANTAAVARRAKRRNSYSSERSDDDLQQKLSTVTDEKEAKRLKRCAVAPPRRSGTAHHRPCATSTASALTLCKSRSIL